MTLGAIFLFSIKNKYFDTKPTYFKLQPDIKKYDVPDLHIFAVTNLKHINKMKTAKIIKYTFSILLLFALLFLSFRDFKMKYLTSFDKFCNWWIDTYMSNLGFIIAGFFIIAIIYGIISLFTKK